MNGLDREKRSFSLKIYKSQQTTKHALLTKISPAKFKFLDRIDKVYLLVAALRPSLRQYRDLSPGLHQCCLHLQYQRYFDLPCASAPFPIKA